METTDTRNRTIYKKCNFSIFDAENYMGSKFRRRNFQHDRGGTCQCDADTGGIIHLPECKIDESGIFLYCIYFVNDITDGSSHPLYDLFIQNGGGQLDDKKE